MRQKSERHQGAAERTIKDIGAATENVRFAPENGHWRHRALYPLVQKIRQATEPRSQEQKTSAR